jgi:hypothetical protein
MSAIMSSDEWLPVFDKIEGTVLRPLGWYKHDDGMIVVRRRDGLTKIVQVGGFVGRERALAAHIIRNEPDGWL